MAAPARAATPGLSLTGHYQQGGSVLGRTSPRAQIFVDGQPETVASDTGFFVVGFDRDAGPQAVIQVVNADGEASHIAQIAPGDFDIQRINGLAPNQVNPTGDALLARIKSEAARKAEGFASRADLDGFKGGFIAPLAKYRQTTRFGGQRILNGEPRTPHFGADLAAATGTPIRAPAAGVIAFAETGMHFEGGLTMIDHGQGLISLYLHQSRVDVRKGEVVARGQVIGAVGKEGRATGPHLCWRMKWHGRNLDPMLLIGVKTPA